MRPRDAKDPTAEPNAKPPGETGLTPPPTPPISSKDNVNWPTHQYGPYGDVGWTGPNGLDAALGANGLTPALAVPSGGRVSTLRTLNEVAVPGIVIQPQSFYGALGDLRNDTAWGSAQIEATVDWPAVARIEGLSSETLDGGFNYFTGQGAYRYGRSSAGIINVSPPNVGGEQLALANATGDTSNLPTSFPALYLNLYQTNLSFGIPSRSAIPTSGYVASLTPATPGQFTILYADSAGSTVGPSTSGITYQGIQLSQTNQTINSWGVKLGPSPCVYGDGSDGTHTADGSTALTGASRSGSVYTLNQDVFYQNLTINNGVTLKTNGYILHVRGTLTNSGTIANNGNAAVTTTAGAATHAGTLGTGLAGVAGLTVSGVGNGTFTTVPNGFGGNGGAGGAGGGNGGGGAQFPSPLTLSTQNPHAEPLAAMGLCVAVTQPASPSSVGTALFAPAMGGGTGGGGGLAAGASNSTSGASGGGGGPVIVLALILINNGNINALGGNGGNAVAGADGIAAGGGGGGGGGFITYQTGGLYGSGAMSVAAGSPGTGANGGVNGGAAGAGTIFALC